MSVKVRIYYTNYFTDASVMFTQIKPLRENSFFYLQLLTLLNLFYIIISDRYLYLYKYKRSIIKIILQRLNKRRLYEIYNKGARRT